jgi:hypothetical protein
VSAVPYCSRFFVLLILLTYIQVYKAFC